MKQKQLLNYVAIGLLITILFMVIFFQGIVTNIVLYSFSNFVLNGIVFAPECTGDQTPEETGCYDPDTVDGGQVLNCLHGGACPIGVSYSATGSESEDSTPDSDPDPGDGGIVASDPAPRPEEFDSDGDGILDINDGCVFDAETVNGFLDDDGCPERDDPTVNDLPEVDPVDVLINPPDVNPSFIDEVETLGFNANDVNLNDTVDAVFIMVVIIIVFLVLTLLMILKKNLQGKKRR